MIKVKEDMTGWVMAEHGIPESRLIVVKQAEDKVLSNGQHRSQWLCMCTCCSENPKYIIVDTSSLKNGNTKSCGCLKQEKNREILKKYNKYDLTGEYGIGWASNKNIKFYFDLEDYNLIKDYCWYISSTGYVVNKSTDGIIFMHRLITHCESNKDVDHINHVLTDNRKTNLRSCSTAQNAINHILNSNNTSGYSGVYWNKRKQKWNARVWINTKEVSLGHFNNKEDAIQARKQAENEYYGEFVPIKII